MHIDSNDPHCYIHRGFVYNMTMWLASHKQTWAGSGILPHCSFYIWFP